MMYRTDDPVRDFEAQDREQQRRLARCPICYECGEPIQDEKLFYIDGRFYHEDCMEEHHKYTEDYEY